ncbi:MAG: cyclic nucleotide-binding domain-containing protein [Deltaproteobacteria bacterium]|nr:cyclic nucleotide-binding domain-containing protein [Deltaproteobacteria bacterium]
MSDKLRKLKDDAAKLVQKGKLEKAIEVYDEILAIDSRDVTAHLKRGDIFRKLGQNPQAIEAYTIVAQTYAADGLLLKAIAACKLILEIDSDHTLTQKMLADLYAKKTGRAVPVAVPTPPTRAPTPVEEITELGDEDVILIEEQPPPPIDLPTIPLFSDLPKNAFIQLMEQMHMRSMLPEEVIIREGDVGDSMFIISSGRVKVTKVAETGNELVLAYLGDGAFFGEMALIGEAPRSASVIADEETVLFEVSRVVLAEVIKNFSSVAHIIARFYRQRLLSNLMATSAVFRPLDPEQRRTLIEKFKSREVAQNEKLLEEGAAGDGLYLLLSGKAEVSKKTNGKRTVVAHLKEGDVFGEHSLLTNEPVNATIRTLRKSIVLKLPKRAFLEVASTHPQLLEHISDLSQEREKTNEAILTGKLHFSDEGLVVV